MVSVLLPPPLSLTSLNGSLPTNVEIKNNTLFFKGTVTYDLAGTYVCDATNSIGTRTGIVDVNITGKLIKTIAHIFCSLLLSSVTLAWLESIKYPSKKIVRHHTPPLSPYKHSHLRAHKDQATAAGPTCPGRAAPCCTVWRVRGRKKACVFVSELHTYCENTTAALSHPPLLRVQAHVWERYKAGLLSAPKITSRKMGGLR